MVRDTISTVAHLTYTSPASLPAGQLSSHTGQAVQVAGSVPSVIRHYSSMASLVTVSPWLSANRETAATVRSIITSTEGAKGDVGAAVTLGNNIFTEDVKEDVDTGAKEDVEMAVTLGNNIFTEDVKEDVDTSRVTGEHTPVSSVEGRTLDSENNLLSWAESEEAESEPVESEHVESDYVESEQVESEYVVS